MRKWYLFIALALVAVVVLASCRAAETQEEAIDRAVRATLTAMVPTRPSVESLPTPTEPRAVTPTSSFSLPPRLEGFTFRPEPGTAKGDPNAPVTVVEFSDYQ